MRRRPFSRFRTDPAVRSAGPLCSRVRCTKSRIPSARWRSRPDAGLPPDTVGSIRRPVSSVSGWSLSAPYDNWPL